MSKDFEELFACLRRRNVKALIVGGYAVAFHGQPRFTKDIDVFIEASPANADRLLAALSDFGFGALGLTADDFSTPGKIVQLGVAPNRVDLLTVIDGVTFDEAWSGRVAGHYGDQAVDYIGRAELVRNKRASGRPAPGPPKCSPMKMAPRSTLLRNTVITWSSCGFSATRWLSSQKALMCSWAAGSSSSTSTLDVSWACSVIAGRAGLDNDPAMLARGGRTRWSELG